MANHRDELFTALQRLLPQHCCSRLLGKLADSERPWLKNRLIALAMGHYGIDLAEAEITDPMAYPSFNAFFTRHLRADARLVDLAPATLVAPADGALSQLGAVSEGRIFQAKGHCFSAASLLACSGDTAVRFASGSFATVYLAPRDYHRVHMPYPGKLLEAHYIPGALFSVNSATTSQVDQLFARNERLSCVFATDRGLLAVVLVGALFVAGIETVWEERYVPGKVHHRHFDEPLTFAKGDELGAFRFGSTVIVVSEAPLTWDASYGPGSGCKMGGALGVFA